MNNKEDKKIIEEAGELEQKLAKCEQEKEENLNGWKRARADFINYQKDEARRFEELLKYGQADLIRQFIGVLDSFDLALESLEKEDKVGKGIYMIRAQLEDVLKKQGLERMVVAIGQPFDPNFHETVAEMECDYPENSVAEEIERGYLLNGKVIRPARVKVVKSKK